MMFGARVFSDEAPVALGTQLLFVRAEVDARRRAWCERSSGNVAPGVRERACATIHEGECGATVACRDAIDLRRGTAPPEVTATTAGGSAAGGPAARCPTCDGAASRGATACARMAPGARVHPL